jgi:hypothetical protein
MEAPPLQRKLVAILAADVAGYSRLMEADEERALAILSTHRRIIDDVIARHRGRVAGTAGDSVLAEFASLLDAAQAAIEIQNSLAEANDAAPKERRMEFRIGLCRRCDGEGWGHLRRWRQYCCSSRGPRRAGWHLRVARGTRPHSSQTGGRLRGSG